MDMHTVWLWISIAWLFVLCGAAVSILIWGVHLEAILLRCFKLDYCPLVIALMLVPCCCLIVEV